MAMSLLALLTSGAALILLLLLLLGVIGPPSARRVMRNINTWLHRDAELLLPINPYKPLRDAVMEHKPPFGYRFRNNLSLVILTLVLSFLAAVLLLALTG